MPAISAIWRVVTGREPASATAIKPASIMALTVVMARVCLGLRVMMMLSFSGRGKHSVEHSLGVGDVGISSIRACVFETVGQAYLEQAEPVDVSKVMGWRSRSAMPWLNRLHSTITGLRTRHRRIGDHQLTWLEAGPANAEPVVLIHGFGASKENWLAILPFCYVNTVFMCRTYLAGVKASLMPMSVIALMIR